MNMLHLITYQGQQLWKLIRHFGFTQQNMQAYRNTRNKYRQNDTYSILCISQIGQKRSSNLQLHNFLDTATSLQIYHWFPEKTQYKGWILGQLKFSRCVCIKLSVQARFLPFFCLCQKFLGLSWQRVNNKSLILSSYPSRFVKYLRNYNEASTKHVRLFWFALFKS